MAEKQEKKQEQSVRLDVFRKAVQLSVEGDQVTLQSIHGPDDEEFHVTPRKFSKKAAAKIRSMLMESSTSVDPKLQTKIRRLKREKAGEEITEEMIESMLTDEEMASLYTVKDPREKYEIEQAKLIAGIALQDFSDPPGLMSAEIADLVLEAPDLADEILKVVDELNPPFLQKPSESSGT